MNIYIMFATNTRARVFADTLKEKDVECKIVQTPSSIAHGSCSYCVLVHKNDVECITNIMQSGQTNILGIYEKSHDEAGNSKFMKIN